MRALQEAAAHNPICSKMEVIVLGSSRAETHQNGRLSSPDKRRTGLGLLFFKSQSVVAGHKFTLLGELGEEQNEKQCFNSKKPT